MLDQQKKLAEMQNRDFLDMPNFHKGFFPGDVKCSVTVESAAKFVGGCFVVPRHEWTEKMEGPTIARTHQSGCISCNMGCER